MAGLEFCCNPFKQRNHNPEPWRLLPVTKSLREQFRLYLGDDSDICISCKRKLYCTLPNVNSEEPLHDSIPEGIEETDHWTNDAQLEAHELNNVCDYLSSDEHYSTYHLGNEEETEQHYHSEEISESEVVTDTRENVFSNNVTHQSNSREASQILESTKNGTSW